MKRKLVAYLIAASLIVAASVSFAANIPVGAAPKGDAATVASRIIKYNFPQCKKVTNASRRGDGSILATCDGTDYLVSPYSMHKKERRLSLQ